MTRGILKHTGAVMSFNKLKLHLKYVGFRPREGEEKGFFSESKENADYQDFLKRIETNKALTHANSIKAHKIVFSLREKDYTAYKEQSGKDFKDLVRETLKEYEQNHNVKLDWIASIHDSKGHPHGHVIIKGVSDKKGDRGCTRIRFDYKKDLPDLRRIFENNFYKGISEYSKLEELEYKTFEYKPPERGIGNGIDIIINAFKKAVNKGKEKDSSKEYSNPFKMKGESSEKEIKATEQDASEDRGRGRDR